MSRKLANQRAYKSPLEACLSIKISSEYDLCNVKLVIDIPIQVKKHKG